MDNVILKSLSAENFASFAERIEFSTETDSGKKEHLENTFTVEDMRFNKVSFLSVSYTHLRAHETGT